MRTVGRWSGAGSLTAAAARYSIDGWAEPREAVDLAEMIKTGGVPFRGTTFSQKGFYSQ